MSQDLFHVLVRTSFIMPMKREDFIPEKARVWCIAGRIEEAIRGIVSEFGLESECCSSCIGTIDGSLEPQNASRCGICGEWVSAQNRPEIIPELKIGAEHEDEYYCWDHLPQDSEWLKSMPKFGELPPPA
jgi:hypothetical protein